MRVEVKEITPHNLFRECAEMTTGKPCKMSWATALKNGHSLIRAQEWLIKLYDIPQMVAGHLVRHVHAQPYMLSKRADRGGEDFRTKCGELTALMNDVVNEHGTVNFRVWDLVRKEVHDLPTTFDRYAPTSLALKVNAEEIINISHARLCTKASKETREVWQAVVDLIAEKDPDLAKHCVPKCIYRGGICGEPKSCKYYASESGKAALCEYKALFGNCVNKG